MEAAIMNHEEEEEEAQAQVEIWKYMFGFTEVAIVKCAIELGIPDILEKHAAMTLAQLSSAIGCNSPSALYRIMRFLTHRGIFKEVKAESVFAYSQTALSRCLMQNKMASFVLLHSSPVMVSPWHGLSKLVLAKEDNEDKGGFEAEHGKNMWQYMAVDPSFNKMFNDAMACIAPMTISKVVETYPTVFEGIGSLVDVGGGNGAAMCALVKAFPSIRGINFDLPHVVSSAPKFDGVEHVGGNFFDKVPNADAVFIMWVLHDWDDDACVKILKNCKDAIPDTGKVVIVDAVIDEVKGNKYRDAHLALDIIMMSHTIGGKQRTSEEWRHVITAAGYTRHTIKHIPTFHSVIEAFP